MSAPSRGAVAEAYRTDGTRLAAVPLVDGVGIAPLAPPTADLETVRVLDARGALVAEVPVERG